MGDSLTLLPTRPILVKPEDNADTSTLEFKSLRTKGVSDEEVQYISHQLLLQTEANWGDLLSAAPRTLCSLGQCFVIAWSESADSMVQERDESMYSKLELSPTFNLL